MIERFFLLLFVVIAALELVSEFTGNRTMHLATKPFIALLPLVIALSGKAVRDVSAKRYIVAGLIFSWVGDCVLMFRSEYSWALLAGLGAFMLAHICYIFSYRVGSNGTFTLTYFVVVPILGYGIVLYSVLAPYLGGMNIPVAVYAVILLGMLIAALERFSRTHRLSYRLVSIGAALFVISDSVLAWNIFVQESVLARIVLMSSYSAAQMLITLGMVRHWSVKE